MIFFCHKHVVKWLMASSCLTFIGPCHNHLNKILKLISHINLTCKPCLPMTVARKYLFSLNVPKLAATNST